MEARRPRLLIKGYLRGLFPTAQEPWGIRSIARKEIILQALAMEEEAELLKETVYFNNATYGNRIPDGINYKDYAESQSRLFTLYQNKYQLIKATLGTAEDDLRTSTQKLIADFKYMKEHGILNDMREKIMKHRAKFGIT